MTGGKAFDSAPTASDARVVRKPPRPSWALAYILQDWKRERDVAKAYRVACADEDFEHYDRPPSDEVWAALETALSQLQAYVCALESVVSDWSTTRGAQAKPSTAAEDRSAGRGA